MKEFLENLIKQIVDNPDEAIVEETTDETGRTTLLISVADPDMGRVIGKAGKVINAIRTIVRIMAIRQGVRVRVDVKDTQNASAPAADIDAANMAPEAEIEAAPEFDLEEADDTSEVLVTSETEEPEL